MNSMERCTASDDQLSLGLANEIVMFNELRILRSACDVIADAGDFPESNLQSRKCDYLSTPNRWTQMINTAIGKPASGLGNRAKEALFEHVLHAKLVANGFVVATPSPDLGEDLWFCRAEDRRKVWRAQLKSVSRNAAPKTRYKLNISQKSLEAENCVDWYIFG